MITSWISDRQHVRHHMGAGHPESPERLATIEQRLNASGLLHHTVQFSARPATEEQILEVHSLDHWHQLQHYTPSHEGELTELTSDTLLTPWSIEAARMAAGAATRGIDQLYRGQADNVFCAVRPPGHHAERTGAMGFCLLNNVAIAAAYARTVYGVERIAILDFDVHQCNGTIDIFQHDSQVLICSSFQEGLFPQRYHQAPSSNVINTPLPLGSNGDDLLRCIERQWLPAIERHRPQLICISAGFDAHRDDPLGGLNLTGMDYHRISRLLVALAREYSEGRLLSVLEGGYDMNALAEGVEAHLAALIDLPWSPAS
ncbi:histone deacetylase family protein [Kushneria phosphatilytica]|uniref:Histone deacetylase family protein n=1 Tax=Kushneria phosphatilytica TaxID=657387 RepID=A0A1S1NWH0_9GAMM|nr:histone deacetylase family protein [Kushneria phosphatilytica]OHV11910.1 deacetylase [Kushneria phosphatilytica]QEL11087.1 histone deacetylase family protein [Kushneria phosphatilytica]